MVILVDGIKFSSFFIFNNKLISISFSLILTGLKEIQYKLLINYYGEKKFKKCRK